MLTSAQFAAADHMLPRPEVLKQPSPFFDSACGMWRIHEHNQVRAAYRDAETFTPTNALLAHVPLSPAALRILTRVGFALPPTLANNGGPTHAPMRTALMQFFSPARVKAATELTENLVTRRVQELNDRAPTDRTDLVAAFAWEIPARIMFDIIGVPHTDEGVGNPAVPYATFKQWSQDSLELFWGWPDPDRQLYLAQQAADFYAWLKTQVATARATPDGSLFAALTELTFGSPEAPLRPPMTDREICAVGYFLYIAGQETTCQLITTALHYALDSPLWQNLTTADAAAAFVREILRADTPVHTWRRRTSRPVRVGEALLPAGAEVLLDMASSGHDPNQWVEPEVIDVTRRNHSHQAFGTGIHRCVGAPLAEMEARVTLMALAAAWPNARLDDPSPEWLNLLSFRAPRTAFAYLT